MAVGIIGKRQKIKSDTKFYSYQQGRSHKRKQVINDFLVVSRYQNLGIYQY